MPLDDGLKGTVGSIQMERIDEMTSPDGSPVVQEVNQMMEVPPDCDDVNLSLKEINCTLVDHILASALEERAQVTTHMIQNGITRAHVSSILFEIGDATDDQD